MTWLDDLRRGFRPIEPVTTLAVQRRRMAVQARASRLRDLDEERTQTRAIDSFTSFPPLEAQLLAIQGLTDRPWRAAGLREALGVPAIFGACTLIAKTVGSMTMRALRNEVEIPPEDRPRLIVRPDPRKNANTFYYQTAWNVATRGEAWWWISKRDGDGVPMSLYNVNPAEVMVTINERDLLRPIIRWRNVEMRNEDMVQIPYVLDPGSLRGAGPLQICQAAISVAVEAQEWAANFYADGGQPGTVVHSAEILDDDPNDPDAETEAERFAAAWSAKGNNRPRVVDPRIESIEQFEFNPQGAQMLDGRMYQNGDTARAFNIPGTLLEYAMSGSSLTYQNLSTVYEDFLRRCLRPNYLAPIEAAMSDLVPRAVVARFDTDQLTLADPKTRYDTYAVGITAGILTAEQAQAFEGIQPGNTDNAPVPYSPPQAFPASLPIQGRAAEVRCAKCNQMLAELASPPYRFTCRKCRTVTEAAAAIEQRAEPEQPTVIAPVINVPSSTVSIEVPGLVGIVERMENLADRLVTVDGDRDRRDETMRTLPADIAAEIVQILPEPQRALAPEVHVHQPEVAAPEVRVNNPPVQIDLGPVTAAIERLDARIDEMGKPKVREVKRDKDGRIVALTEWTKSA